MLHRRDCDPEKDGGLGEICDVTNMRNIDLSSGQQQVFAPKRIRLSADNNILQDTIMEFCKDSSPLGLKLQKTPSFINLIEMKLSQARKASEQEMRTKMDYEKLKASNFSIALLKIGNWQKKSINEGDLIAKCYFAKKKIVWEVLEGALKSKIEIQWSDIIGIRANLQDGHYGLLEIELNNPPLYFQETNPQPRKHTLWQQSTDFTDGQAPMHRRHFVVFPPGVLNKHYEKLLQCDQRLLELSKKPFPTLNSPYFGQKHFGYSDNSFNINGNGFEFMPLEHAQTFNIPVTIVHPRRSQNFKPIPNLHLGVMDSTPRLVDMDNEIAMKWEMGTQGAMLWNQDFNIMVQQSPMEINGTPGLQYQEFCPINSGDNLEVVTPNSGISCPEIGNHLLTDHSQVACSNINSTLQQGGFSWSTPQNSIMTSNNLISNNQALYSYVLAEPTSQDIADLDASQNIGHNS